MNKTPIVSVIIPTYNRAPYVTEALDSVLAQTFTDYEIIVIDDGSTDNTKEVLQPYFPQIRYFFQENQGVSAARNVGIREAKGEWLAFLDSDDVWLPKKLEIQFKDIHRYKDIDLHICNGEYIDGDITQDMFMLRNIKTQGKNLILVNDPFIHLMKYTYACLPSIILKKKQIYFEETMHNSEDLVYLAKFALIAKNWLLQTNKLVKYIRRSENKNISLTQRRKEDIRFTMQVGITVANTLGEYLNQDKYPGKYLNAVKILRSNNYFSFAIKCKNPTESRKYLLKGLLARITLKNILKFFVYYCKTMIFQLSEAHNDNRYPKN